MSPVCSTAKSVNIVNCAADFWATCFLKPQEVEVESNHLIPQQLDFASTTIVTSIKGGYIAATETQSHAVDCRSVICFTGQRDLFDWQIRWANIKIRSMEARQAWVM